jgi:hypothetical protein
MSANLGTSVLCPNWHCKGRRGFPPSPSPASWTLTPWPGWNRRWAGLSAPCAARCAISGVATWRSPSISRRPILSAEAARDRGSQDPPATGHQMARVHGPQPHPATCGKLATRDANRTSYPSARTLPPDVQKAVHGRSLVEPRRSGRYARRSPFAVRLSAARPAGGSERRPGLPHRAMMGRFVAAPGLSAGLVPFRHAGQGRQPAG